MGRTAGGCQLRLDADRRDVWERREEAERAEGDRLLFEDMVSRKFKIAKTLDSSNVTFEPRNNKIMSPNS